MAQDLFLIKPSRELAEDIWKYRQEYLDYGEAHINGSCGLARCDNFERWLELVLAIEKARFRNGVHASTFFSVRKTDNKLIGSIQLRHDLTPLLAEHGGHIGYGIRPSERKKGYGKQQLLLILPVARHLQLQQVMITCDADNIPSNRIILSCGGILTDKNNYEGKEQHLYWLQLN